MKVDTIVGIDLGTSKVRVVVTDLNGCILGEGSSAIEEQTFRGWKLALGKATPSNILSNRNNILVSADGTSGTIIIVDEIGEGLCEPIMYYSNTPILNHEQKSSWHQRNLINKMLWFGANSTLAKLGYALSNMGKDSSRIRWILPQSAWLLYMLKFAEGTKWENIEIDPTNALKFGADVINVSPNWLTSIHKHFKIPQNLLPTIVPFGSFIGEAQSSFAEKLGLGKALLYQGMTDGNAAALVAGTFNSDEFTIIAGSTSIMKTVIDSPKATDKIYYQHHPLLPSKIFATAWIPSGKVIESTAKEIGCNMAEALYLAEHASSDKPAFVDQYNRDFFQINEPDLQKIKERLNSPQSYGYLVNFVLEEMCMREFYYIYLFEKIFQRRFSKIRMIGGTTKSDYWCSMRASIFQKPIEIFRDLTPIGAVFPALLQEGIVSSIDELKKRFCFIEKTFNPNMDYEDVFKRRDLFLKKYGDNNVS